jgi:hypothetical protein
MLMRSWIAMPSGVGGLPSDRPSSTRLAPAAMLQLHLHEVDPGDLFGDGVLHLQARIGLDERELRVAAWAAASTRNSKVPTLR